MQGFRFGNKARSEYFFLRHSSTYKSKFKINKGKFAIERKVED